MTFIDDLLTFEKPLTQGETLFVKKRLFGENIEYRAHKTKAGLYVVLPHCAHGAFYHSGFDLYENKSRKTPALPDKFSVESISKYGESILSTVAKDVSTLQTRGDLCGDVHFRITHTITNEGNISALRLSYDLSFGFPNPKRIQIEEAGWFNITPDFRTTVEPRVSIFSLRHDGSKSRSWGKPYTWSNNDAGEATIDYDTTLQNLCTIMQYPYLLISFPSEKLEMLAAAGYVAHREEKNKVVRLAR